MTFEITIKTASPAPRLTKIKVFERAGEKIEREQLGNDHARARACIARKEHVTRAREFEMSSRAPVSSRAILFSSRGGDLPRAQASVVRSV